MIIRWPRRSLLYFQLDKDINQAVQPLSKSGPPRGDPVQPSSRLGMPRGEPAQPPNKLGTPRPYPFHWEWICTQIHPLGLVPSGRRTVWAFLTCSVAVLALLWAYLICSMAMLALLLVVLVILLVLWVNWKRPVLSDWDSEYFNPSSNPS